MAFKTADALAYAFGMAVTGTITITTLLFLPLIRKAGIECPLDSNKLSYFLSTIELCRGTTPGMNQWRKRLFITTSRITADAAEYFHLPRDRTVIMGSRIEL